MHLVDFFDKNPSNIIQDVVDNSTKSFKGLEIKKSRVAKFMKNATSVSKFVTRHPAARNSSKTLEVCAKFAYFLMNQATIKICVVRKLGHSAALRQS